MNKLTFSFLLITILLLGWLYHIETSNANKVGDSINGKLDQLFESNK